MKILLFIFIFSNLKAEYFKVYDSQSDNSGFGAYTIDEVSKSCSDMGKKLLFIEKQNYDCEYREDPYNSCIVAQWKNGNTCTTTASAIHGEVVFHSCGKGLEVDGETAFSCSWILSGEYHSSEYGYWYEVFSSISADFKCVPLETETFGLCDTTKKCQTQCCEECECVCPPGFQPNTDVGVCGDGSYYMDCVPIQVAVETEGSCRDTNTTDTECYVADPNFLPVKNDFENINPFEQSGSCPENEEEINGICTCKDGYYRAISPGACFKLEDDTTDTTEGGDTNTTDTTEGGDTNTTDTTDATECDRAAGEELQEDGSCKNILEDGSLDLELSANNYLNNILKNLKMRELDLFGTQSAGTCANFYIDILGQHFLLVDYTTIPNSVWNTMQKVFLFVAVLFGFITIFRTK